MARPQVVDLFAGAGGLSLGFEQAGYDVAAAVELDPVHAATHERNFPVAASICADVRDVDAAQIRKTSGIGEGEVHTVVGGAPCQGFSLIGKRALDDPRNALVAEFVRVVLELQPRYFVLENVSGLTVGKHRQLLDEAIELFAANGYQVLTPYRVLQAAAAGVPQGRKRLFLIGARSDVALPVYPSESTTPRLLRGGEGRGNLPASPSVWEAIGDLPEANHYEELLERDWVRAKFSDPSTYAARLRGEEQDPSDFSRWRTGEAGVLTSSMRTVHTQVSIDRFAATEPGTVEPISRFLRLHPEGIANTLRAGTASDRGAFTSPRPLHPTSPRCITVREAARLHGYPDWFRFHVTKWHGFRQIGNSVPPPLARTVAAALLAADGVEPSRGEEVDPGNPALLEMTQARAAEHFGVHRHVVPPRARKEKP